MISQDSKRHIRIQTISEYSKLIKKEVVEASLKVWPRIMRVRIKRGYGCGTERIDGTDMRIKRGADMRIKRGADMRIKRGADMRIKRGADMRIKRG